MQTSHLTVFLMEAKLQCGFALRAEGSMRAAFESDDPRDFWLWVQTFLGAVANISKIFWPNQPEHRDRGEALRRMLEIPSDHVLRSRKIRNFFEHFDEQLHEWIEDEWAGFYSGPMWFAGRPKSIEAGNVSIPWPRISRIYNPDRHVLHIGPHDYSVEEITKAVRELSVHLDGLELPPLFSDEV